MADGTRIQERDISNISSTRRNPALTDIFGRLSFDNRWMKPQYIPGSKSWDFTKADLLLGDFTRAVIGTRDDMTFETLREATVGDINHAECDMLAVKCTMRMGFNVIDSKAFSAIVPKAGA